MPRPLDVGVPVTIMQDYLKWLYDPRGVCFGFCVMTAKGMVNITLPWLKVKRG